MNEKLKSYLEKGKNAAGKVSKKAWIIAGVVLVVLAAAITIYLNTRPWVTLIVSSDQNELSAVLSWLDEQGYRDYRLEGDTILVPSNRAYNLKAGLLQAGYPKTGYLHNTYFDNINMMSTESERTRVGTLDLQDELSYVLSSIPGIKSASVHITPGEDNAYILDPSNVVNAKASVYVVTRDDELLNSDTVLTIRNFVAHAVQGLTIDEVTVMDQYLTDYTGMLGTDNGNGSMMDLSIFKLQIQAEYENRVRRSILQLLQKMFGAENVEVAVNCDVDVNTKEVTDYQVHQPEGAVWTESGLGGIIGERRYSYTVITENGAAPGGTVGTTTNSDLPDDNFPSYVERDPDMTNDPDRLAGDGELIYDNPKTQTHHYINSAEITDCHVSVTINSTTAGAIDVAALRELVANAAGINAIATEEMTAAEYLSSKVSIYSHPFFDPTEPGGQNPSHGGFDSVVFGIPMWVLIAAAAGLVLFIIILLVIMLLRGKRRKKKIADQAAQEAQEAKEIADIIAIVEPAGEEPKGADVMELQTERSMELRQDIRQFAEENPEVAAQLLKAWLRGGEDDG